MKTVFKRIAVFFAVGLFALCIFTVPKKVKAVDINNPTYNDSYTITIINIAEQLMFSDSDGAAYILYPPQLKIYGIKKGTSGVDVLPDNFTSYVTATGAVDVLPLPYGTNATMHEICAIYSPAQGTSASNYQRYYSLPLFTKYESSEVLNGEILSYTVGPYKSTTLPYYDGFYIKINFTVGYKQYMFYITGKSFISITTNSTTVVQINSADTVGAYNQGKSDGQKIGYTEGYNAGTEAGEKAGYNTGYTKGYNDGRTAPEYSFTEFFIGFGDAFLTIWAGMLDFEFLGINIAGLIGTVLVVILVVFIVKLVKG